MKILITGGAGFIGANLANFYLTQGHQLTIYDNLHRPGVENNLAWLKNKHRQNSFKITLADVRNFKQLQESVKKQNLIFHLAGQTAVTTSIINPQEDFAINALGTFNLLEAVRSKNPQAVVIYSSTNKVYGALDQLRLKTLKKRYLPLGKKSISEAEPISFHSPYGCSKGCGDQYMLDYARVYGLKTIVFRQSCIYGAHQFGVEDQGWVAYFAALVLKGKPLTIFGNGKQVRDILYIDDLLTAYDLAYKNLAKTKGKAYNIGGGINNSVSLLELIDLLTRLSGKKVKISFTKSRISDQKYFVADNSQAFRDFSFQPKISVTEGIKKLLAWLQAGNR